MAPSILFTSLSHEDQARFSPFMRREHPWTLYEVLKTALLTVTVLPLRLFLVIFPLFLYAVLTGVAARLSPARADGSVSPFRMKAVDIFCSSIARIMLFGAGFHWIHVVGTPDYTHAPIIVSSHSSWVDMLLFLVYFRASVVTKAAVRNIPLLGFCGVCHDNIWVERSGVERKAVSSRTTGQTSSGEGGGGVPASGASSGADVVNAICQRAAMGVRPDRFRICLFPEGTTSNGQQLLSFFKGAFVPGAPVAPMVLRYSHRSFDPAYTAVSGLYHAWRLLTQFHNSLEVVFLPVYFPSPEEKENPELYAKNVQEYMAKAVGIPATKFSLKDFKDYEAFRHGRYPRADNDNTTATSSKSD